MNIESLSRDLGRNKKTVRNALNYLELSFLIKRVSNLRGSFLSTSRKNRKAYPLHPSLSLSRDEDMNLECMVRSETNAEINEGFVVSRGDERSIETDGVRIEIVPVTKFFIYAKKYDKYLGKQRKCQKTKASKECWS